NSTISALNSDVNDRRARGLFFSTVSILDILPGATPHWVDVRQTGSTPKVNPATGAVSQFASLGSLLVTGDITSDSSALWVSVRPSGSSSINTILKIDLATTNVSTSVSGAFTGTING